MKHRKRYKIIVITTLLIAAILFLGMRRDHRKPNQQMNQYWAVRSLDVWTFYRFEIYAKNQLAVYDMTRRTTKELPNPLPRFESEF